MGLRGQDIRLIDWLRGMRCIMQTLIRMKKLNTIESKFSSENLKDLKGFDSQLDSVLKNYDMTRAAFNNLKLKPHDSLTNGEVEKLKAIRESVQPITKKYNFTENDTRKGYRKIFRWNIQ